MTLDRTTPPPTSPSGHISLIPEQVETLDNGLTLHIVNTGDQPISRLGIYREGGLQELGHNQAVTTIMGEAFREQTRTYSADAIADIIDFNGARISSRASAHHVGLDLIALNSRLPDILPMLSSIITEAKFTERNVEVPARKAAANRAIQMSKVAYRTTMRLRQMLQGPLNPASVMLMPADFEAVTAEAVAHSYHSMNTRHIHAFLGGAMPEATVDAVRKFLASLHSASEHTAVIEPFAPLPVGVVEHIVMPDAQQSAVSMGMNTISREHTDYIALRLAVMALGGYFGSRLMQNIREEQGLTYGINASLLGTREGAFVEITAQCDAANLDTVIAETRAEIYRLAQCPPEGEELHRLQQHAWSQLAASVDSSFGILDHYVTRLIVDTPHDYFESQLAQISSLTPDRIAQVAAEYLDPNALRVVTAGV